MSEVPTGPTLPVTPPLPQAPQTADDLKRWAADLTVALGKMYRMLGARADGIILHGPFDKRPDPTGTRRIYYSSDIDQFHYDDGDWIPIGGGGGGGAANDEILVIADTSAGDVTVTLLDPAALPNPNTIVVVKVWRGGTNELHIAPGVGATIDGVSDGIRTRSANQSYRFRWGPSADEGVAAGWVCIGTVYGWDGSEGGVDVPPPEGTPGVQPCTNDNALPIWIQDFPLAATYVRFTDHFGTWNKPVGPYTFVAAVGWGAGGGGGAGYKAASSDFSGGGTGGGGGARKIQIWKYADFPDSIAFQVGDGGLGGPGRTLGGDAADGSDGESTFIRDNATSALIFFVGAGKGGHHTTENPNGLGGQGGSWSQDGTTLGSNENGTDGDGGGAISSDLDHGAHRGCAACGGAAGAGPAGPGTGGPAKGGSSVHGGAGGGVGGTIQVFPLGYGLATEGGSGDVVNGGGGAAATVDGASGTDGTTSGTDLGGGTGGGGGYGTIDGVAAGKGGDGGIPGGGGAGGGAVNHSNGTGVTGSGGKGARGELRFYVI